MPTLSIIVPCYNEQATVVELLHQVLRADLGNYKKEIIVVDDGSSDTTPTKVRTLLPQYPELHLLALPHRGKGAAIKAGLKRAIGDLVVVQDADLEYDPNDWRQMLELFRLPPVHVVFGSRRLLPDHKGSGALYYWGAQCINLVTNLLYGVRLSDQFTCYKMMRRHLLEKLNLQGEGFEIDGELVAKLLKLKECIYEVPITYHPRNRQQGKKIKVGDGARWFWQIIKHRFLPLPRSR